MPSDADRLSFQRRQNSVGVDDTQRIIANMPPYPKDLKDRFPSMAKHEDALKEWIKQLMMSGGVGGGGTVA